MRLVVDARARVTRIARAQVDMTVVDTDAPSRSLARSFVRLRTRRRATRRTRERASEGEARTRSVSTRARRDARRARGGDTRETVTRANDALETNDALDDARGDDGDGGERDVVDDEDDDDARICLLGRRRRVRSMDARWDEDAIGTRTTRRTRTRASATNSASESAPNAPSSIGFRQKLSVACVMLAVFLHLLGFTVTGPITPGLVQRFDVAAEHVGYLTSAYPLGMFGALFFWPQLSDKIGRKPIIVTSLMGVGVGLILQALCVRSGWSLQTFLALRVLSGAFAGASPVVKAYLADASTPEFLPQLMAWREASCTLAFIVGPTLGGMLLPDLVSRRRLASRVGIRRRGDDGVVIHDATAEHEGIDARGGRRCVDVERRGGDDGEDDKRKGDEESDGGHPDGD